MSTAVLFGLNYAGTNCALRGCINDVRNMAAFLTGKYATIHQYTDESEKQHTTHQGILRVLNNLADRAKRGELTNIFVHYSGHGSYVPDKNGDEADGKDECLVPSDYQTHGLITDDVIHTILAGIPASCRVTMVMDCCHSGTICDLVYRSVEPGKITSNGRKPIACKCIMMSGCLDSQTSADAYNLRHQGKFSGALTTCLLECLPKTSKVSDLHRQVQNLLRHKGFSQVPQVCASFDFGNENFIEV